ncbi:hypothetical protein ACIP5Y_37300 [Nocardia sp. NPDC088792]
MSAMDAVNYIAGGTGNNGQYTPGGGSGLSGSGSSGIGIGLIKLLLGVFSSFLGSF